MPYALSLAGPEVLLPNPAAVVDEQRRICRRLGPTPISPLDEGDGPGDQTVSCQERIFAGTIALIEAADANVVLVAPATVVLGSFEACIRRVAADDAVHASNGLVP